MYISRVNYCQTTPPSSGLQFDEPQIAGRASELSTWLARYQAFWSEEVLVRYPVLDQYPGDWIDDLAALSPDELYDLERGRDLSMLRASGLRDYWGTCLRLSQLPPARAAADICYQRQTFNGVSAKKRHEIELLLPHVQQLVACSGAGTVYDYCGGVGYFAQALVADCGIGAVTLDVDERLQDSGRQRFEKFKGLKARLEYRLCNLARPGTAALELPPSSAASLGLHTCGTLANCHLKVSIAARARAIINFGCCYYKNHAAAPLLLSAFIPAEAERFGFELTEAALTMASRSHRDGRSAYFFSKRVKLYRYMIHLYLYHEAGRRDFVPLGNSAPRLYRASFADYAREQLQRLNLPVPAAAQLEAFFRCPLRQRLVTRLICANIVRAALGRLIELYLCCDRALYLAENGYRVSLAEYFDPHISPRNIGVIGLARE